MTRIARLLAGLRALTGRARHDQQLDAELRDFLERSIDDKVRAGMSREAAERAARMELGSETAVRDAVLEVGWEHALETTWEDARHAARSLRRSPGFTTVAVLTLALGIGATTAIFTIVHALMLRALPVSHPEELVEVLSRYPGEPRLSTFSWRHYEYYRDHSQSFSDLAAVSRDRLQVGGDGLDAEIVDGEYVSGNLFDTLRLSPLLGRLVDDPGRRLELGDRGQRRCQLVMLDEPLPCRSRRGRAEPSRQRRARDRHRRDPALVRGAAGRCHACGLGAIGARTLASRSRADERTARWGSACWRVSHQA
ncbi:MAG: permease prefix domain 1-containing protein [Vicinamibacterales bacterium]